MNKFWTIFVPGVLGAVGYYAYTTPGFVGSWVRRLLGPIVEPVSTFISRLF